MCCGKRWIFLLLILFCVSICRAQNFGGFPPSTKWQQINTDTARIIFPRTVKREALRIAQLIHAAALDTPVTIGTGLRKINIVLHSQTTQANGYVALGPFRSEYYLIPGGDIFEFGNLPWHENLAVHEYRHVQQYNNFDHGLTKIFSFFGGQNGRALANALAVPDWFFEGDAVYAETAFTGLGRGRQPFFLSAYNSLWQEGKNYPWMKLRNGSYKDFVPNHYPLGYLLVNYGYLKYGPAFWSSVTKDASSFKSLFYPFQHAVERNSHEDFKKFQNEALGFYKKEVPQQKIVDSKKGVTNYYFPQSIGKDSLLYVKETYRSLPYFYIKDKRGEHQIKLRSISSENWLRYAAGKIVYTAYSTSSRWSLIDYSNIILLDLVTKRERQLTFKQKYFTPDLSPDGTQLIAVRINDSLQTELHLLNAENGAVIKKMYAPNGGYFIQPKFLDANNIVLGIRSIEGLLSLQTINLVNSSIEGIIPPQHAAIGDVSFHQDTLYFTASFSGNDDLYAYNLTEKKLYQLTTGKTGNYYPAVFNNTLVWSKFTTNGLQLQQQPLNKLLWQEVLLPKANQPATFPVASSPVNLLKTPTTREFTIKKYSAATGLFNIHSWDPGVDIYSNNILNTMTASLYYRYNETERAHTIGVGATYGGFFPVLNTTLENTLNRHIETTNGAITANQWEWSIGYNIPLNFTKGKTIKNLNFGSSFVYENFQPTGASKKIVLAQQTGYLHHFATWSQHLPQARQQIYPRLGYALSLHYRQRIDEKGYQVSPTAAFYLPTFSNTHALVVTGSLQQADTGNVLFSNHFLLARGYPDYYYSRMWNVGFNYHLPLAYPDWGVANLVYFLRVRANLFYDYSQVRSRFKETAALRSTGAELYFDTRWWNELPVGFGVRYSYLLDRNFASGNRNVFEFIVPVNLIPF